MLSEFEHIKTCQTISTQYNFKILVNFIFCFIAHSFHTFNFDGYQLNVTRITEEFLVWVFFNIGPVKMLLQSELYSFSEFLSVCGGLLGLFLGVSALSIIEIAYHFTLRLFWSIHHRKMNRIGPSSAQETDSQDESQKRSLSGVSKNDMFNVNTLYFIC